MIFSVNFRKCDKFGCGHHLASRGTRAHNGVDIIAKPNDIVLCIKDGEVTKLGYCYRDDLSYRYVQVTDSDGTKLRYFYVTPSVRKGDKIKKYTAIGRAQDLEKRYEGITPHVHFEVMRDQEYLNPMIYLIDSGLISH